MRLDEPTEAEAATLAAAVEVLRRRCVGPDGGDEPVICLAVTDARFVIIATLGRIEREVVVEQPIRDTLATDIVEGFRLFNAGGNCDHDAEALGDASAFTGDAP